MACPAATSSALRHTGSSTLDKPPLPYADTSTRRRRAPAEEADPSRTQHLARVNDILRFRVASCEKANDALQSTSRELDVQQVDLKLQLITVRAQMKALEEKLRVAETRIATMHDAVVRCEDAEARYVALQNERSLVRAVAPCSFRPKQQPIALLPLITAEARCSATGADPPTLPHERHVSPPPFSAERLRVRP